MKAFFSGLWMLASTALGAAVLLGLIWFVARAHSFQWRKVSRAYSGRAASPRLARKALDSILITARGPAKTQGKGKWWRLYPGVQITVHQDGLALSQIPPFNIICPPLFLPFDEMEVTQTWWAMWPDPVAMRMTRAPEIDIILARDTVLWLRDNSDSGPFRRTAL